MTNAPMVGTFGCCVRATNGHAVVALLSVTMNSRRWMRIAM
jgi:hypothetical protein